MLGVASTPTPFQPADFARSFSKQGFGSDANGDWSVPLMLHPPTQSPTPPTHTPTHPLPPPVRPSPTPLLPQLLGQLQLSTIVVMAVGARLPQIWLNIQRGNAGVLSVATCVLNVTGCVIRIFTTLVRNRV